MATATSEQRAIGILGGTFDPVHLGHLALARQARDELDLEVVLFVPNADPPHKQHQVVTAATEREAMVAAAISDEPAFVLDRLELEREGPSYAVETVAEIAARSRAEGRPEPWFILSAETLAELHTWRDPERILELARFAVAPRAGAAEVDLDGIGAAWPGYEDRFAPLAGPTLDIASTTVRDRVAAGEPIDGLVPAAVAAHIEAQGLYVAVADPRMATTPGLPAARPRRAVTTGSDEGTDPIDADVLALAHRVVEAAQDKKASDIVLLDVRAQTTMTDYFVLCTGASDRQLGAIAEGIIDDAAEADIRPISREGEASSHWLLIDFGGVIVHVMSAPERDFYRLEELWAEAALLVHIL